LLDTKKYQFIKEVILDDRRLPTNTGTPIQVGYKPDKKTVQELGRLLPNCKILGFRLYYMTVWSVMIADPGFVDDQFVTMTSLKHQPPGIGFLRLLP
jgi:hypothetical protein